MNHGPRSIYIFALRFKKLLEYVRDLFAHTPVVLVCHLLQCGIHRRRDGNGSPLIQIHLFTPRCVSVTVTHNNLHNGEVNNIMRPHNKNRDGKRSELLAAEWLFSQDCYVYATSDGTGANRPDCCVPERQDPLLRCEDPQLSGQWHINLS